MMRMPDHERFDISVDTLCTSLRWKGQFILAEHDDSVPPCNDGLFWCMHTQTCVGPDGKIAEPANCSGTDRECHCGK